MDGWGGDIGEGGRFPVEFGHFFIFLYMLFFRCDLFRLGGTVLLEEIVRRFFSLLESFFARYLVFSCGAFPSKNRLGKT